MEVQYLQVAATLILAVLSGVITWCWKLDSRVFDLRAALIGREEFRAQMLELRGEIQDLRRLILESKQS